MFDFADMGSLYERAVQEIRKLLLIIYDAAYMTTWERTDDADQSKRGESIARIANNRKAILIIIVTCSGLAPGANTS